ncbi:hypothetical protein [Streptomyces sp. NPDC005281]|uniref:hypothetical protein n=1 Tax=Streptomyces sp. NPDC005281 TaxID=3155712 RepID=UPI0033BF5414
MKDFLSKHAVRLIGLVGALAPVLVARWPGVPWEALVGCVAALLGLGEVAQRKQDEKTATAWALAEAGQLALAEIEKLNAKQVAAAEAAALAEPAPAEVPAPQV